MISPRAIEVGARAAYHATPRNKPYDRLTLFKKEKYRAEATAVLTALAAEGMVVVPLVPTQAMIDAATTTTSGYGGPDSDYDDDVRLHWTAMINAAQPATKDTSNANQ